MAPTESQARLWAALDALKEAVAAFRDDVVDFVRRCDDVEARLAKLERKTG